MIGQTISHYKILEKLGEGGMGVVYRAHDTMLDRTVALKFLPRDLSPSEEERSRFIHEAKAASALDHPNICTIYEIGGTPEGLMFIAMGYYEGISLSKKIEQGRLDIAQQQIRRLLIAVRQFGPEVRKNVQVRPQGRAVIHIVGVNARPEERFAGRALKAGASGYITKESATEELVQAIRKIAGGGKYVSAELAEQLATELQDRGDTPLHETLSDREFQVMRLFATGKKSSEIAEQLSISVNTVNTYRMRVLQKMNMQSDVELSRYALEHGLIE